MRTCTCMCTCMCTCTCTCTCTCMCTVIFLKLEHVYMYSVDRGDYSKNNKIMIKTFKAATCLHNVVKLSCQEIITKNQ